MADLSIFKNPYILAILAGAFTYMYIYYENEQKYKKNPKTKKPVSWVTPIVVTVITWVLAYSYFKPAAITSKQGEIVDTANETIKSVSAKPDTPRPSNGQTVPLIPIAQKGGEVIAAKMSVGSEGSIGTLGSQSYHLIGKKNIRLPNTDVFIDLVRF